MRYEVDWHNQKYLMEWSNGTDFENLDKVVQSYGFIFDKKGRICIVDCNGYWCLPGGKPEDCDETFEDTLIREVDEEANLDIKNIKRIGYFQVTPLSDNCERKEVHHILRYTAEVDNIKKQTIDPANGKIPLRKFVDPSQFVELVGWEDNGELQLGKALKIFEERLD